MFSRLSRTLVKNTRVSAAPLRTNAFPQYNQIRFNHDDIDTADDTKDVDLDQHATLLAHQVTDEVQVADSDDEFPWLDPRNPPRLDYEHVKLIKNIDYSPIIKRARGGAMFTVDDVLKILEETGASHTFKSTKEGEHYQTPFIFSKTFDVFQKGQKKCPLCLPDPTPERVNRVHYTNVNLLRRYVNDHGMILNRHVSGCCGKHQRQLRYAIKNARSLALISPCSNWHVPVSYVYPEKYEGTDQAAGSLLETVERNRLYEEYRRVDDFDGPFDEFINKHNAKYAHLDPIDPDNLPDDLTFTPDMDALLGTTTDVEKSESDEIDMTKEIAMSMDDIIEYDFSESE